MFQRFTDEAREAVVLAQDEARRLGHGWIGTEHLLLGLVRGHGRAGVVLARLELTVDEVRDQVERIVGRGDELVTGGIPFTPRTKRVIQLASKNSGIAAEVGTETILFAMLREGEGVANQVLDWYGATADKVFAAFEQGLSGESAHESNTTETVSPAEGRQVRELSTGAELRVTGDVREQAVVCVNGGTGADVPGTWSASLEWLVRRLAPRFPELAFGEVKYRIKSWKRLDMCAEDALAAISEMGAPDTLLIGFSMGGAVAIKAARHASVSEVVGLAPWIPERLDLSPLDGRRLVVFHGSLDRYLPGIPGVSPKNSRSGYERARARGVEASYTLIPGALHGIAVRVPGGRPIPLPRARKWASYVASAVETWSGRG